MERPGPKRDRELRERLAADFPGRTVLTQAQGGRSGGEDGTDYDHIMAATDDGIMFCERRRGVVIVSERWHTYFSEWVYVGPVVAAIANKHTFWLYVADAKLETDTVAFLAVIQEYVADPSGYLGSASEAALGGRLRGVLHGAADTGGPGYAPRPVLLACTDAGILLIKRSPKGLLRRTPEEPTVTRIGWDEKPTAVVIEGPLPSVQLRWKSGKVRLRCCVLGDVEAFAQSVCEGASGRSILS